MSVKLWTKVDRYIDQVVVKEDAALTAALTDSAKAGLPVIAVSPSQGKLLHLLALARDARKILEIGTLGGYSTIWLARALPANGKLVTIEYDPKHAEVAGANIARAGLSKIVDLHVGAGLDVLPKLTSEAPFDLSFIDADKANNPNYFSWALKYSRPGSFIIVDNVVRDGKVADASSKNENVLGARRLFDVIAAEPRVSATVIQTVGSKGYDGFLLALVTGDPA